MPYAETHYRVLRDRQHRAIAGLSMGGAHTLNIAIPHPDEFAYVGVFSSGIIGIVPAGFPAPAEANWEQQHLAELDDPSAKKSSSCSGSPPAKTIFC
jgi:enterochelin esterase-like enzyme